jgi:serine/threonine protein kinase
MSDIPDEPGHDKEELCYLSLAGDIVRDEASSVSDTGPAPEFLTARSVRLADGTVARQLQTDGRARQAGYLRLDNEILAGLRLAKTATADAYPPEVSRLIGYEPTSVAPFALLEPCRGDAIAVAGRRMLSDEQRRFQASLLAGLCWLAAAGIVHRALGPSTVRWDGQRAQITDFSRATVIGAPRQAIGEPPWAAPEQRRGQVAGLASDRDDVWAAGQLIYYVRTGRESADPSQLSEGSELEALLAGVFGPARARPSARQLLQDRLGEVSPVPDRPDVDSLLTQGRKRFMSLRARKHPGTSTNDGSAAPRQVGQENAPADRDNGPADGSRGPTAQTTSDKPSARRLSRLIGGSTAVLTLIVLLIR